MVNDVDLLLNAGRTLLQQHIAGVVLFRFGHGRNPLHQLGNNPRIQTVVIPSFEGKVQTIAHQIMGGPPEKFKSIKQNVYVVRMHQIVVNFLRATAKFVEISD